MINLIYSWEYHVFVFSHNYAYADKDNEWNMFTRNTFKLLYDYEHDGEFLKMQFGDIEIFVMVVEGKMVFDDRPGSIHIQKIEAYKFVQHLNEFVPRWKPAMKRQLLEYTM